MDAIEQMMKRRADELKQIVGSEVSLHCYLTRSNRLRPSSWFTWWAIGQYSDQSDLCFSKPSYAELKTHLQKRVDEIDNNNATSQQQAELNEILLAL